MYRNFLLFDLFKIHRCTIKFITLICFLDLRQQKGRIFQCKTVEYCLNITILDFGQYATV